MQIFHFTLFSISQQCVLFDLKTKIQKPKIKLLIRKSCLFHCKLIPSAHTNRNFLSSSRIIKKPCLIYKTIKPQKQIFAFLIPQGGTVYRLECMFTFVLWYPQREPYFHIRTNKQENKGREYVVTNADLHHQSVAA